MDMNWSNRSKRSRSVNVWPLIIIYPIRYRKPWRSVQKTANSMLWTLHILQIPVAEWLTKDVRCRYRRWVAPLMWLGMGWWAILDCSWLANGMGMSLMTLLLNHSVTAQPCEHRLQLELLALPSPMSTWQ